MNLPLDLFIGGSGRVYFRMHIDFTTASVSQRFIHNNFSYRRSLRMPITIGLDSTCEYRTSNVIIKSNIAYTHVGCQPI